MDWYYNITSQVREEEKEGKSIDYKSMKDNKDGKEVLEVLSADYNLLWSYQGKEGEEEELSIDWIDILSILARKEGTGERSVDC